MPDTRTITVATLRRAAKALRDMGRYSIDAAERHAAKADAETLTALADRGDVDVLAAACVLPDWLNGGEPVRRVEWPEFFGKGGA